MSVRERMAEVLDYLQEVKLRNDSQLKNKDADPNAFHVGRHLAIRDGRPESSNPHAHKTMMDRHRNMKDKGGEKSQRDIYRGARNEFLRAAADTHDPKKRKGEVRKAKAMQRQVRAWAFKKRTDDPRTKVHYK